MTEAQTTHLQPVELFGLTGPMIKASQGDKGAFVTAMEFEMSEGWTGSLALLKPTLIDLELLKRTTRGKRKHPERLNEWAQMGCDSLNCSITKEGAERDPKRSLH